MPMFPDSGVVPSEAKNSLPDVNTACPSGELWYSTSRCQPRFDPAAANAMLAEDMNLIMKGELQYDCARLDHIERAVRYINQRGLPRACVFAGGPFDYTAYLDPGITRHNDFMTLTIIPNVDNQAAATLNLGLGAVQILRNDGAPLKSKDLRSGKPAIIAFWAGYWYMVGLVASQVPLVAVGAVDGWVRTDGNDYLGDGTANTPDKAFRTINGAWSALGGRYAASPLFSMNIRLGIPGTYEWGNFNSFGGNVSLTGDPNNRAAYRVVTPPTADPNSFSYALRVSNIGTMVVRGINMVMNNPVAYANGSGCLMAAGSVVWFDFCQMTLEATSTSNIIMRLGWGAGFSYYNTGDVIVEGNGHTCSDGVRVFLASTWSGSPPPGPLANWYWRNVRFSGVAFAVTDQSVCNLSITNFINTGTTGKRYHVSTNGLFYRNGVTVPGDVAGTFDTQGQVF